VGEYNFTIIFGEVCYDLSVFRVFYYRSNGNAQKAILSTVAVLVASLTVRSALGLVVLSVSEIEQGVEIMVGPNYYVATFAAVAAVGPAQRNEFFSSEANAPSAAIATSHVDFDLIDEHRLRRA
jgi:hypothetical protein